MPTTKNSNKKSKKEAIIPDITQTVTFDAPARNVYALLLDEQQHAAFTESPASVSPRVGGKFTAYDDYVDGENVELSPYKKIVQKWRASDWPEEHYSIATFAFVEKNKKTTLTFTQSNVPREAIASIAEGWKEFYWDKMKKYLKENK